ncbi:MAG TPA: hypothetical protein VF411_01445 [Bacteroidia bacterium]
MKTSKSLILLIAIVAVVSCKKDTKSSTTTTPPPTPTDNYSSVNAFFSKNGVAMQSYTINGTTGGSFTSPQGTTVTIPANAFLTQASVPVTGNVIIQFKDIYKKSDMLLSNMPTMTYYGNPLKSGGEFFIKAIQNNAALILASGKKITVSQPISLTGGVRDTLQKAFIGKDTTGNCSTGCTVFAWVPSTAADSVQAFQNYIFSLYQMNSPADSGSWCNSDNSSYFAAYPQTTLTLLAKDSVSTYGTYVFLLFKNLASMVHVYNYMYEDFPYYYAPQGLQCTMVAVGVKSGTLYSSFVPITIGANQTYTFSLSATTTSTFTTQLQTLN